MTVDHVEGMFQRVFGLSGSAARVAAGGNSGKTETPVDHLTGTFQSIFGMSREAAGVAAAGRGMSRVSDLPVSEAVEQAWLRAQRVLDAMSDAECDAMLEEERRRKPKPVPAKKTAPAAPTKSSGSGRTRPVVISERSG
jgi:hypothetical protein